jgi:hypothetical protein
MPLSSLIFGGAIGSVGNITFRQRNGNTIVCRKRKKMLPADKQIVANKRLKMGNQENTTLISRSDRKSPI